jgi:hypothetical protein
VAQGVVLVVGRGLEGLDPMTGIDKITGMSAQDAARWRGARTLGDLGGLGELTAQWLEGAIGSVPGVVPGYRPRRGNRAACARPGCR